MIRQCGECGQPTLRLVHRKMEIYNSVCEFKCENCKSEVKIIPIASTGILASVGILALAFWGYLLFFHGRQTDSIFAQVIYGGAVLALISIVASALKKHINNPVAMTNQEEQDISIANDQHIGLRPILWLEKLGFLAGMLVPIIVVASILVHCSGNNDPFKLPMVFPGRSI